MNTKFITRAALVAALYVVLTYISNIFGLANGAIQIRISEALTILPILTPSAIPGLFAGCLFANLFTGAAPLDIVFGSVATLLGAVGTYLFRKNRFVASLCPVIANVAIIPIVLIKVYNLEGAWWYFAVTIGIGEIISCMVIGLVLLKMINKRNKI